MESFKIENLNFAYPGCKKQALKNINFTIEQGEYIALCGKSGCGKSTLLRHLKTVLTPHGTRTGNIYFEGNDLQDCDQRTQAGKIGYVLQNPDSQIVTDKVWHELAFGLESLGYDNKTIRLRVAEMASYFGIQTWFHKNVNELSGGQKQLLNLASVMAMQPTVLILDEPTSQLDPIAAADFLNTVKKINRELGTTIIISEHRLEDVFHCADRVVVMEDGALIAVDTPKKVGYILKEQNNELFCAMPSPVQIFYGVEDGNGADCPLTVREGRGWITELFNDKKIKFTALEEETYEPEKISPKEAALWIKEVWFRYDKNLPDVLRGVNMKVPRGDLFAIVGGNGTGKSTTLKAICGINKPYRGKVFIEGKEIGKYKTKELFTNNLAMLPQDPQSLFVKKTVREELLEMMSDQRYTKEEKEERVKKMARLTEISDLLQAHPFDLSGGEQQRAALAKVLLTNPKILLLDEPTKGIDNFFKIKLAQILKRLNKSGVTIVMVSHDVEFCAKYADSISMFFDGDVLTTNTPRKFFSCNSFYTTAANRMSRHLFENAVTNEDVIALCKKNLTTF